MISQMFCLPYAGGSASIYSDWVHKIENVDVYPFEYAGRGNRFCDDYYSSIEEAARDVCTRIQEKQTGNYVIYGHSMGCLVALETAFLLEKDGMVLPKAIIVAATRPPHLMYKDKPLGSLSRDELMKEIASLGQMEKEVMECEELYEIVADILYSDIQMFTKYRRTYMDGKINIPIIALTGNGDNEAPEKDMEEWRLYTKRGFMLKSFEGNHFFAFDNPEFMNYIMKIFHSI